MVEIMSVCNLTKMQISRKQFSSIHTNLLQKFLKKWSKVSNFDNIELTFTYLSFTFFYGKVKLFS